MSDPSTPTTASGQRLFEICREFGFGYPSVNERIVGAEQEAAASLREALEGMANQFAHYNEGNLHTGGLSALEDAFDALGWPDPYPAPWRECDVPGCKGEYTCGWPSPDGYRKTCGEHYREARSILTPEADKEE